MQKITAGHSFIYIRIPVMFFNLHVIACCYCKFVNHGSQCDSYRAEKAILEGFASVLFYFVNGEENKAEMSPDKY